MECLFFFKQKTAYEMRISDWSSDVCSSDLAAAEPGDPADDLLVDLAREDHLGNLGGRRVGDAKPADKGRFDAELFQHRADLRPAAVHDDRIDADGLQEHDILGEVALRSEEHTSELPSLMRISYAVFCLNKKNVITYDTNTRTKPH